MLAFHYGPKDKLLAANELRYFSHLKKTERKLGSHTLTVWYQGDQKESNYYSLYPENSMQQRNLRLELEQINNTLTVQTDWIGSVPVFFNEKKGVVASHWGLIDKTSTERDLVAIAGILKHTYISPPRTTRAGIKRMGAAQTLEVIEGRITIRGLPVAQFECSNKETDPSKVEEALETAVGALLPDQKILIPTSSGFDSRMLALKISKFTTNCWLESYALTSDPNRCYESTVAKQVGKSLNLRHETIELTVTEKDHQIRDFCLGGFSRDNGAYYYAYVSECIRRHTRDGWSVASGLVGDMWAGKHIRLIDGSRGNLPKLSAGGGLGWILYPKKLNRALVDYEQEVCRSTGCTPANFKQRAFNLVSGKIQSLTFLASAFELNAVKVSTPFLDKHLVNQILSMPRHKLVRRKWQNEIFERKSISDKNLTHKINKINELGYSEASIPTNQDLNRLPFSTVQKLILRLLFSSRFRKIERLIISNKVLDILLRKIGYKRTDQLGPLIVGALS